MVSHEWVTEERFDEAARLLAPEFVIDALVPELHHAVQTTHDPECALANEPLQPVSVFGSGSAVLPLCLVCEAIFTQLMPTSLAMEFAKKHVEREHPTVWILWQYDYPWMLGDPRLN